MKTYSIGLSSQGKNRDPNEDFMLLDDDLGLYVVCDGTGGHPHGELAAEMAAVTVQDFIETHRGTIDDVAQNKRSFGELTELCVQAIQHASRRIWENSLAGNGKAGMTCSLTMVVVCKAKAVMAHVGDTRLVMFRGKELHQLSVDHTIANEYARRGIIKPEEVAGHTFEWTLTNFVGSQPSVFVDTLLFDIFPGDRLLLHSNGLTRARPSVETLKSILSRPIAETPRKLYDLAKASEYADDVTVVAIDVEEEEGQVGGAPSKDIGRDAMLRTLAKCRLFHGLALTHLQRIANNAEEVVFNPGASIAREGQECKGFYLVLGGELAMTIEERAVSELGPGEFFGVASLLRERKAHATIRPLRQSIILYLSRRKLESLCDRYPRFGVELMRRVGSEISGSLDRAHQELSKVSPSSLEEELPAGDLL